MLYHSPVLMTLASISGITSITVAAVFATGPWALPLAALGMVFIRWPHRSKGKERKEEEG